MADAGVFLGVLGMTMGVMAVAVLFFASDAVLPRFKRTTELLSFMVLAVLIATSILVLDNLFAFGDLSEGVAAVSLFVGVSLIIHIARTAE